jgi:hypothetical protein
MGIERMAKTDQPGYLKDRLTGVIINTNDVEYQRILQGRAKQVENEELAKRVGKLEAGIDDIKNLLTQLMNRDSNG